MKAIVLIIALFCISCSHGQDDFSNASKAQRFELPEATYEEAGFNRDSINTLLDLINETPHKDFRGIVVIKDNHIVLERYYNTFWRNTIHDVRSAGKSVTTLLLGIAMKEGLIKSLDQDVYSLFSEAKNSYINQDYKKVKLRDILDMSSGLDADSDYPNTKGQAGNWMGKNDWKAYLLNIPLVSKPGERFIYADMNPLLIGLAIEEATGMSLKEYAQSKLFDPLGIEQVYWYTNAANQTGAAGNLYITTLDFAKLGLLITNEGTWGNHQLISPEFIEEIKNRKNPAIAKEWNGVDFYGMFWYKDFGTFGGKKMEYMYASGIGGNHLVVLPEQELVIALTSSAYGQPYQHGRSYAIMEKVLNALNP